MHWSSVESSQVLVGQECILGKQYTPVNSDGQLISYRALTYISAFTKRSETPLYNALIGLSWGVGSILGPVVGGALSVSSATWRWVC